MKKKERSVRDAIAEDKLQRDPVCNREVIITDRGNTLCYDAVSGRYFNSDRNLLEKVENDLNRQMRDEMYISLNEFYYALGLAGTKIGNDLGWHIDDG